MKKILAIFLYTLSFSCFAANPVILEECGKVTDRTASTFCGEFKDIAHCHCRADSGNRLPDDKCYQTKTFVYPNMLATFGSQDAACRWQAEHGSEKRAKYQECMDDWNCYMKGGKDSNGGVCGSTGRSCE